MNPLLPRPDEWASYYAEMRKQVESLPAIRETPLHRHMFNNPDSYIFSQDNGWGPYGTLCERLQREFRVTSKGDVVELKVALLKAMVTLGKVRTVSGG